MNTKKGFTFIEVVLVLAIAGLIFTMTFVALPALWASQRDTARREGVMKFVDTLQNYQMNNSRGALPGTSQEVKKISKASNYGTVQVLYNGDTREIPAATETVDENSWAGFYNDYFNETFVDPDGPKYNWLVMFCQNDNNQSDGNGNILCENKELTNDLYTPSFQGGDHPYTMFIVESAMCYGETAVYSPNARKVAVLYRLEAGGIFCANT